MVEQNEGVELPLAIATQDLSDITVPFKGDLLNRKELAKKLTSYINRLKCGAVISLDAPWGEGKTWFSRHWAAQLKKDGYGVGLIDAFQEDYTEDPFLLLASEIRSLSEGDKLANRLTDKAAALGAALLPLAAKTVVNGMGKLAGTNDLVEKFSDGYEKALEKGSEFAQEWTKKRIESYRAERDSVAGFKRTLGEFTAKQSRPTVIFIDELDRCRPAFAVRMIERIKHFFDVPNLVFVLVMNRTQLEKAIRGVYGAETDAAAYLGKFLHLSLQLPKERSKGIQPGSQVHTYVQSTLKRYGVEDSGGFASCLSGMVVLADMSLRDVERACALYILAGLDWNGIVASLVAIKVKYPAVYDQLRLDYESGLHAFSGVTKEWQKRSRSHKGGVSMLAELLAVYSDYVAGSESDTIRKTISEGKPILLGDDSMSEALDRDKFRQALLALELDVA